MAAYVDVMEKKMDSVLDELTTVKNQLHKMEEREAEKGLKVGDLLSGFPHACAESVYLSNALIHVCYGLLHILADTL